MLERTYKLIESGSLTKEAKCRMTIRSLRRLDREVVVKYSW